MKQNGRPHVIFYAPTPPPYAGPEIATEMLLNALKGKKIRATHIRSNVKNENLKKGLLTLEGTLYFLQAYTSFLRALLSTRSDKVYFLLSVSRVGFIRDAIIIVTSKLFRKKTIAHYRGGKFNNFYNQQSPFFRWFIKQSLKRIDCLIVQAEILKPIFKGLFPEKKMQVLYNGIKTFPQRPRNQDKPKKTFTIFFMGHIAFAKGLYELIQAFIELRRRHSVRLLFAGARAFSRKQRDTLRVYLSGERRSYFDSHAGEIEKFISDFIDSAEDYNARYLGVISGERKAEAFEEADVFVLPSYSEGFSMSVLEAMAYGLPVVVTPVGAIPEFVTEGVNGYFVQPGDSRDLERKLEWLILNGEKHRSIGNNNRRYVASQFSIEKLAEESENILSKV